VNAANRCAKHSRRWQTEITSTTLSNEVDNEILINHFFAVQLWIILCHYVKYCYRKQNRKRNESQWLFVTP